MTIMNPTSPYREAQRRAAIEIGAGVLDVFFPKGDGIDYLPLGYYKLADNLEDYPFISCDDKRQKFPSCYLAAESPIRYRLKYYCGYADYDGFSSEWLERNPQRHEMWRRQWETLCENWNPAAGEPPAGVFIARIELYDGDNERQYKEPFAKFDQVVGFGTLYDLGSGFAPSIAGYTE